MTKSPLGHIVGLFGDVTKSSIPLKTSFKQSVKVWSQGLIMPGFYAQAAVPSENT